MRLLKSAHKRFKKLLQNKKLVRIIIGSGILLLISVGLVFHVYKSAMQCKLSCIFVYDPQLSEIQDTDIFNFRQKRNGNSVDVSFDAYVTEYKIGNEQVVLGLRPVGAPLVIGINVNEVEFRFDSDDFKKVSFDGLDDGYIPEGLSSQDRLRHFELRYSLKDLNWRETLTDYWLLYKAEGEVDYSERILLEEFTMDFSEDDRENVSKLFEDLGGLEIARRIRLSAEDVLNYPLDKKDSYEQLLISATSFNCNYCDFECNENENSWGRDLVYFTLTDSLLDESSKEENRNSIKSGRSLLESLYYGYGVESDMPSEEIKTDDGGCCSSYHLADPSYDDVIKGEYDLIMNSIRGGDSYCIPYFSLKKLSEDLDVEKTMRLAEKICFDSYDWNDFSGSYGEKAIDDATFVDIVERILEGEADPPEELNDDYYSGVDGSHESMLPADYLIVGYEDKNNDMIYYSNRILLKDINFFNNWCTKDPWTYDWNRGGYLDVLNALLVKRYYIEDQDLKARMDVIIDKYLNVCKYLNIDKSLVDGEVEGRVRSGIINQIDLNIQDRVQLYFLGIRANENVTFESVKEETIATLDTRPYVLKREGMLFMTYETTDDGNADSSEEGGCVQKSYDISQNIKSAFYLALISYYHEEAN